MTITKLLGHFRPPGADATDDEVRHWRGLVTICLIATILMFAWLLGAMPYSDGVAFAEDVNHPVSAEDFAEVVTKLNGIETEQIEQKGYLKQLVKSDLREQINRMVRFRCEMNGRNTDDDDEEKDLINSTIANYQEQFDEVAGQNYDEPECKEL